MREIKLRAWDKKRNLFIGNDLLFVMANCSLYNQPEGTVKLKNGLQNPYKETDTSNELEMDLIFLQFTGLKDKNGVEIYEGYIIDCGEYHGIKEVLFINGSYKIRGKMGQLVGFGSWAKTTKVLGNKFENPELLTK